MIGQSKAGWWLTGIFAAVILTSIGYGMGRRAALRSLGAEAGSISPAGAPLPTIEIEPIQPQEELAAIQAGPSAREGLASPESAAMAPSASAGGTNLADTAVADESARVREIQLALKAAGFDPGTPDGKMGPRTRAAIRDFQIAHGLQADGKVGSRTWSKLEPFLKSSPSQD